MDPITITFESGCYALELLSRLPARAYILRWTSYLIPSCPPPANLMTPGIPFWDEKNFAFRVASCRHRFWPGTIDSNYTTVRFPGAYQLRGRNHEQPSWRHGDNLQSDLYSLQNLRDMEVTSCCGYPGSGSCDIRPSAWCCLCRRDQWWS